MGLSPPPQEEEEEEQEQEEGSSATEEILRGQRRLLAEGGEQLGGHARQIAGHLGLLEGAGLHNWLLVQLGLVLVFG